MKYKPSGKWLRSKIAREKLQKRILQGVIPKRAIQRFMDRRRRDFRGWKTLSPKRLKELAGKLPIKPPIWEPLRHVQRVCLVIGAREKRFAFFNDTGTGKTFLSIALSEYFYELGTADHILILVPRVTNKYEWGDEIDKHSPGTPYVILEGSTENKWRQIAENPNALLFIESYGGLPHLACKLGKDKRRGKKERNRMNLNPALVAKLCAFFQGVITDEGVNGGLGNHESLPYRAVRAISNKAPIYFTLTGTPFGRKPELLWSQMWLVDHGYTFGETLGLFRATFYSQTPNPMGLVDYTFLKRNQPILRRFMWEKAIRFEANAADLPHVNRIEKKCSLPGEAEAYYERARDILLKKHGNYKEQKNAFLRMRQVSSGFVGFKDDETGEKAKLVFDDNPKLDLLLSTVGGIDPQYKTIIFYEFTWSGLKIVEELRKLDIGGVLHMWGGAKDTKKEKDRFNNDPDFPFLVLQNQFGIGLNIQIARYGIFYESPLSSILRKQCERRVERQESKHDTVFLFDLIMRNTVDEKIRGFHGEGDDLYKAIIQGGVQI